MLWCIYLQHLPFATSVLGHHSNIVAELTGQEMFSERLCAHPW